MSLTKLIQQNEQEFEKVVEEIAMAITHSEQGFYEKNEEWVRAKIKSQLSIIEAIKKQIEGMKKVGQGGEGLPFENSPEIYGNQRIESYKKGYNAALDDLLTHLTTNNS